MRHVYEHNSEQRCQGKDDTGNHPFVDAKNIQIKSGILACAAVTHCSKFLSVMKMRASVRKIASDISHA